VVRARPSRVLITGDSNLPPKRSYDTVARYRLAGLNRPTVAPLAGPANRQMSTRPLAGLNGQTVRWHSPACRIEPSNLKTALARLNRQTVTPAHNTCGSRSCGRPLEREPVSWSHAARHAEEILTSRSAAMALTHRGVRSHQPIWRHDGRAADRVANCARARMSPSHRCALICCMRCGLKGPLRPFVYPAPHTPP
jgi:hypothetical protein